MGNTCLRSCLLVVLFVGACQSYGMLDNQSGAGASQTSPYQPGVTETGTSADTMNPVELAISCPEKLPKLLSLCGTPENGSVESAPPCPLGAYPGWEVGIGDCDHIVWTGECLACEPSCPEMIYPASCGTPPPDCPLGMYPLPAEVHQLVDCDGATWGDECLPCPLSGQ